MPIVGLRIKPIARIAIEWIRPNALREVALFEHYEDFFNTLDEYVQRRLCTPLSHSCLDALVHVPQYIRSHVVI